MLKFRDNNRFPRYSNKFQWRYNDFCLSRCEHVSFLVHLLHAGTIRAFNNATELFCQTILGPRKEWRCVASSCCAYPFEYSASLCVSTITDRLTLDEIQHAFQPEWFHSLDNKLGEVWVREEWRIGFDVYSKLVCIGIFSII